MRVTGDKVLSCFVLVELYLCRRIGDAVFVAMGVFGLKVFDADEVRSLLVAVAPLLRAFGFWSEGWKGPSGAGQQHLLEERLVLALLGSSMIPEHPWGDTSLCPLVAGGILTNERERA